jgi:polysaccharide pyruvyl transferase WcaK-like protein
VRVALFGLLGTGNIGNEGSAQAVLDRLRTAHPDVSLSAICAGPDDVRRRYGIRAVRMTAYPLDREPTVVRRLPARLARPVRLALKAASKVVDPLRTVRLLREVDLVVVPGMGVLEDSLPLRPWGFPYALFGLAVAGRLTGTRVAFVSVGASRARHPVTRRLLRHAAGLAAYRSYRDVASKQAMTGLGVDTTRDRVHPDLAFALPPPPAPVAPVRPTPAPDARRSVAVGVLAYRGRQEDHTQGERILAAYSTAVGALVGRLLDEGYAVRMLTGDPDDTRVVDHVRAQVRATRPEAARHVRFVPADSLAALMAEIAPVDAVVASRYHNVLCALHTATPTVSLGYAEKNVALMREMGLGAYCLDVRSLDVDQVLDLLHRAVADRDRVTRSLHARDSELRARLDAQWADLAALVQPAPDEPRAPEAHAVPSPGHQDEEVAP